jgi:bifunctional NMN adenylyltransferase/nudix hydrolase
MKIGVIIARFQNHVLHAGHEALFTRVHAENDRVVIFLGVSPVDGFTAENPLTYSQRERVVTGALNGYPNVTVLPLLDLRTDELWSQQIDSLLDGMFPTDDVTLYGGRDSFADHYVGDYSHREIVLTPTVALSSTELRKGIKESNDDAFLRGQIFALNRAYPHAYPTVDIACFKDSRVSGSDVLLIQRADTGRWCFPGGFVDPTDINLEAAAKRELQEEVGLVIESGLHYVGSHLINDWRYRGTRDKIMTSFFMGKTLGGIPRLNEREVLDAKWVDPFGDDASVLVSDTHQPLLMMLRIHLS